MPTTTTSQLPAANLTDTYNTLVNQANTQNALNSKLASLLPKKVVLIGDSITSRGNYGVTINSITQVNGLATATTSASHALYPGATVFISSADQADYNGLKTVISRVSSTVFTFAVPSTTVSPATGSMSMIANERISDRNIFELANYTLGSPFYVIANCGATGQNSTTIANRFAADVLYHKPDIVQMLWGINDIQACAAGQETACLNTLKTNLLNCVNICIDNNITPLLFTCLPLDSSGTNYTAARGQLVLRYNQYIRQLADFFQNYVLFLDTWAIVVDPIDATGDWIAAYLQSDTLGVHPNALAVQRMAAPLSTLLGTIIPVRTPYVGSVFDSYDNDNSNAQIDLNPLNIGNTGTKAVTGTGSNTGNVPTGYTCTLTSASAATNVNSLVARSDGFGNDYKCEFVSATANDAIDIVQTSSLSSRVAAGDTLIAETMLKVTGITNISNIYFAFEWGNGGNTYTQPAAVGTANSGQLTDNINWILRTPPLVVPSDGMTSLKTRLKIVGAGVGGATALISRHSITKVQRTPPT